MRLSSIKLAGFKSFVDATKIPFPDPMTCVVGPNGCGKSNVIDAVRWVLGESSAKNLRGDAMTDVIFNGAATRKPVSQASVELVFDNTLGRLPGTMAARNQVAIKRVVTRDGQSLYYLNGSKCRKRDITDIFLGTGLGPRSYAIIEQGMISRLIESKPLELRVFIEEAAGVSKYKERRRETQTRIRSTKENLERLLDVRAELQTQLDKLEHQAQQASSYRELKAQQRRYKGELAVLKWQKLHQQQLQQSEQLAELKEQLAFFKDAHRGEQDVLSAYQQQLDDTSAALNHNQQQIFQTDNQLARLEQQQIHAKQRAHQLQASIAQNQQQQAQLLEAQRQQNEFVAQHQGRCEQQQQLSEELQEALLECQAVRDEAEEQFAQLQHQQHQQREFLYQHQRQLQQCRHEHQGAAASVQALQQQVEDNNAALGRHQEANIVQQLEESERQSKALTERLAKAQSAQLQHEQALLANEEELHHARQEQQSLQRHIQELGAKRDAIHSVLQDEQEEQGNGMLFQLEVQPGYEQVIEVALMQLRRLQVSDDSSGDWLGPQTETAPRQSVAQFIQSGRYPDLLHRIAFDAKGDTRVLDDPNWLAVIDANAHLHGRHWCLQATREQLGVLAQRQQLQELDTALGQRQDKLPAIEKELEQLNGEHEALKASLEQAKQEVHEYSKSYASMQTRQELQKEQAQQWQQELVRLQTRAHTLSEQVEAAQLALEQQLARIEQAEEALAQAEHHCEQEGHQFEQAQQALKQAQLRMQALQGQVNEAQIYSERLHSELTLSQSKQDNIERELELARGQLAAAEAEQQEVAEPIAIQEEQIAQLLEQKEQLAEEQLALQQQLEQAQSELQQNKEKLAQGEQQREQLQEQIQQALLAEQTLTLKAQQALAPLEELNTSLKAVLETLPQDAHAGRWQAQLTTLDKQLSDLGAVNLAAIDEFASAKERKQYLDEQLDDLTMAMETLEAAIAKIDRQTKAQFKATFEQINEDLQELFPKVFGGGSAYLELTSDDLLESGVAIMARPPGKKNSTIHLLSGGEKALTALSLVFSIFRLNPAPFCMLDEVDAPLDDANVGRFCRLVEEMSQTVQFIYISHNKIAMEMAGRLTGVTMAEPGVSRMVAVDIEQAMEMAQAS
ncbi:chromosome segregation SMC family protein [Pseudoalteromonas sp. T1lg75]|uniref:chromosome segregation SMC family protein n=1 Tax=Pseudoalteromonas sp. T1lg75 TaxID=2077102 RepID=UPI000CF604DB|nr:AAA family ATPase [Pseudoalteromonas sp. T1lg75]